MWSDTKQTATTNEPKPKQQQNPTWYNLSCLLQTYCHVNTKDTLSVNWQFLEIYGLTNHGMVWRKDVNQWLESEFRIFKS